ncbi:unnamed protein product [Cuscuta campestris]|uniref:X8 domain-containing protein n=1 Tax=Cuscuta campestris TaxID=132261 RepID=A0A484K4Y8_9ASTE|nr:unnamed protein product [Cuscuta campestris]
MKPPLLIVFLFGSIVITLLTPPAEVKVDARVERKTESAALPATTTLSPPEGNTTFLGGTSWCVARNNAPQFDLQVALDWACGWGAVDCGAIRAGGPCFEPDTLVSHASYAFNAYYQQNGNNDVACNFGGTAMLTGNNPSYETCTYATSGQHSDVKSSGAGGPKPKENIFWCEIGCLFLLLMYWTS